MKVNYQLELERVLRGLPAGPRPRLMLHSCCAPCSSYVLEYLSPVFDIDLFYFNPNIAPPEEFEKRVAEQARLAAEMPHPGHIEVIRGEYRPEAFYEAVRGHEDDPEGGERCAICFRLRLRETARMAALRGDDFFTTTLTISPLKDAQRINAIGLKLAQTTGVPWLPSDFKKKNGYRRSCQLSAEYGLYRQDYCGCVFSRRRDFGKTREQGTGIALPRMLF